MSRIIRRRGILRGLGAAALLAPLVQLFGARRSRGATAALPKVVFFYTPCGLQVDLWHPEPASGAGVVLKQLSAPLEPFKAQCTFMDGVAMYPLSDHQGGSRQVLAGDNQDRKTIDVLLGEHLQGTAPFGSIQLGVQSRISEGGQNTVLHPNISRISDAEWIFGEDNPIAAFDRIFGNFSAPSDDGSAALLAARQKSILDSASAGLLSLQNQVPPSEKRKLESYTESIRALERQLAGSGLEQSASCNPTDFNPTGFSVPAVTDPNQAAYNAAQNKEIVGDLQMEIARLSLACGRSRVVTLAYEHTNAKHPIAGLGAFGVHDSSHFTAPPGKNEGDATPEQMDAKLTAWNNYRVWYAQKLAKFLQMLADTPDVEGSLLDNTIVVHCSELGIGHRTERVPFVFCGGGALGFKLGQAFDFRGGVPAFSGGAHDGVRMLAHSSLLTAVANQLGMPLPQPIFGYAGPQALDPRSLGILV
jgi:hypothetical protein